MLQLLTSQGSSRAQSSRPCVVYLASSRTSTYKLLHCEEGAAGQAEVVLKRYFQAEAS